MGKKRSTKATASIQPYVGPELPDTPEQREVDQDQATGSPAQEAALSPSKTAEEIAKTPNPYDVYEPIARRFFDLQFRPAEITTGSPAQEAVASPSEPETIQGVSNTKRTPVHPDRDKLIVEYLKTTGSPKDISRLLKKNHNINMTAGAISKVKNRKGTKKDREDN